MAKTEQSLLADFTRGDFAPIEKFPHPSQMSVMPVVAYRNDVFRAVGTCFAISNHGLVLTARHVIDDALALTNGRLTDPRRGVGALYVAEPTSKNETTNLVGGILPANKVHLSMAFDLAIMHLKLPVTTKTQKPINMPLLTLGVGLPVVGLTCIALGYHSMNWGAANDGIHTQKVMQNYSATRGEIRQVHIPKRDNVNLSFPCFEVSSRYDGGMSGGPVINQTGSVIGVVCSSFGEPDDCGHLSYASLIGPALSIQIDTNVGGVIEKRFLYDFIVGGSVVTDNTLNSIEISRIEDGLVLKFSEKYSLRGRLIV